MVKFKSKKTSLLDMSKIDELYELGYNQTIKNIENIKNLIKII